MENQVWEKQLYLIQLQLQSRTNGLWITYGRVTEMATKSRQTVMKIVCRIFKCKLNSKRLKLPEVALSFKEVFIIVLKNTWVILNHYKHWKI